jgi:hypothetical protein
MGRARSKAERAYTFERLVLSRAASELTDEVLVRLLDVRELLVRVFKLLGHLCDLQPTDAIE